MEKPKKLIIAGMDILDVSGPVSRIILRYWLKAFNKSKWLTIIITIISFLGLGIGIYLKETNRKEQEEAKRREVLTYQQQIIQLDQMANSLSNLTLFIKEQRAKLKENEDIVALLQKEKEKLAPLVEADRKLVNSVLDVQQEHFKSEVQSERWIGFGLGVVASFIASLVWAIMLYLFKKKKVTS